MVPILHWCKGSVPTTDYVLQVTAIALLLGEVMLSRAPFVSYHLQVNCFTFYAQRLGDQRGANRGQLRCALQEIGTLQVWDEQDFLCGYKFLDILQVFLLFCSAYMGTLWGHHAATSIWLHSRLDWSRASSIGVYIELMFLVVLSWFAWYAKLLQ